MAVAKTKKGSATFASELARTELYKRNQGRMTRQLTVAGIVAVVAFGAYTLYQGPLLEQPPPVRLGVPLVLVAISAWTAFRLVNFPRFADFLISVEAEVDKVTWSSWNELRRATIVVIGTMVFLAVFLFVADRLWYYQKKKN